jgi:hypothetical protein
MKRMMLLLSFAIPSVMALLIVGTVMFIWGRGLPVPEALSTLATTAIGYVFGVLPGIVREALAKDDPVLAKELP